MPFNKYSALNVKSLKGFSSIWINVIHKYVLLMTKKQYSGNANKPVDLGPSCTCILILSSLQLLLAKYYLVYLRMM